MIGIFPKLYPDELMYSLFARISVQNGYLTYRQISRDLFGYISLNPSIEFLERLSPELGKLLYREKDRKQLIMEHTMFPQYAEFFDTEQKAEAFKAIYYEQDNYYYKLSVPKNDGIRYLRYCPLCVENDRKEYGEAYWHRSHQLTGIRACAIHGCELQNSGVQITGKKTPELVPAEYCQTVTPVQCSELEIKLARYAEAVLFGSDADARESVADFLNEKLMETQYVSKRGGTRRIADLSKDFCEYYQDILQGKTPQLYRIRLEKILNGQRKNFVEICQLAMFLGITAQELIERKCCKDIRWKKIEAYDKGVVELLESGVSINETARRLSITSKTVRDIRDRKFAGKKASVRGRGGKRKYDWATIDREMLPVVERTLKALQGISEERPKRITIAGMEKELNLPNKYFNNLPLCRKAIEGYAKTQEEYWAKVLIWAVDSIEKEKLPLNWKHIRNLTNLSRTNAIKGMQCVVDTEYRELLQIIM